MDSKNQRSSVPSSLKPSVVTAKVCHRCRGGDLSVKSKRPRQKLFSKIKLGDEVVYYAVGSRVVVGTFKVKSREFYLDDPQWGGIVAYTISPSKLPPKGRFLSLKMLLLDKEVSLSLFPRKEIWHSYLQGKTVRRIDQGDYELIRKSLNDDRYLIEAEKTKTAVTPWQKKYGANLQIHSAKRQ